MLASKSMSKRPEINWMAIRTAYVVKGWSSAKCATEFGVDPTTIRKRASAEGWTAERHKNTTNAEKVAIETARKVTEGAGAEIGLAHVEFVNWLGSIVKASEADLKEITNPASRIKARRDISEMGERWLKVGRLVTGRKDGEASDGAVAADDVLTIEHQVIEPMKIAVDGDGRAIS